MRACTSVLAHEHLLYDIQRHTFGFFLHESNPIIGPVMANGANNWPASIAAVGLALAGRIWQRQRIKLSDGRNPSSSRICSPSERG